MKSVVSFYSCRPRSSVCGSAHASGRTPRRLFPRVTREREREVQSTIRRRALAFERHRCTMGNSPTDMPHVRVTAECRYVRGRNEVPRSRKARPPRDRYFLRRVRCECHWRGIFFLTTDRRKLDAGGSVGVRSKLADKSLCTDVTKTAVVKI